jgi:prepilin-type processing-associated H-X9-DG protein
MGRNAHNGGNNIVFMDGHAKWLSGVPSGYASTGEYLWRTASR